jgi:hypothetical protein
VSFVAIRPGAFIDPKAKEDMYASGLKITAQFSLESCEDVARCLALTALDIDNKIPNESRIDVSCTEPMSVCQMAEWAAEYKGDPVKVHSVQRSLLSPVLWTLGFVNSDIYAIKCMLTFMQ